MVSKGAFCGMHAFEGYTPRMSTKDLDDFELSIALPIEDAVKPYASRFGRKI